MNSRIMMTYCKRCKKPLSGHKVEVKGPMMTVTVSCPQGHTGLRQIDLRQSHAWVNPLLETLFVCKTCSRKPLSITGIRQQGFNATLDVLCPEHGVDRRTIPITYIQSAQTINRNLIQRKSRALKNNPMPRRWVDFDILNCGECKRPTVVYDLTVQQGIATVSNVCHQQHQNVRSFSVRDHPGWIRPILERTYVCKLCFQYPLSIYEASRQRDRSELKVLCSVHGLGTRSIPSSYLGTTQKLNKAALERRAAVSEGKKSPNRWIDFAIYKCRQCGQQAEVVSAKLTDSIMESNIKCPQGHTGKRYFNVKVHPSWVAEVQAYARLPEKEVMVELTQLLEKGSLNLNVIASKYRGKPGDVQLLFDRLLKDKKIEVLTGTQTGSYAVKSIVGGEVKNALETGRVNLAEIGTKYDTKIDDIKAMIDAANIQGVYRNDNSVFVNLALLEENIKTGVSTGVVNVMKISEELGLEPGKIERLVTKIAEHHGGGFMTQDGSFVIQSQIRTNIQEIYNKIETPEKFIEISFKDLSGDLKVDSEALISTLTALQAEGQIMGIIDPKNKNFLKFNKEYLDGITSEINRSQSDMTALASHVGIDEPQTHSLIDYLETTGAVQGVYGKQKAIYTGKQKLLRILSKSAKKGWVEIHQVATLLQSEPDDTLEVLTKLTTKGAIDGIIVEDVYISNEFSDKVKQIIREKISTTPVIELASLPKLIKESPPPKLLERILDELELDAISVMSQDKKNLLQWNQIAKAVTTKLTQAGTAGPANVNLESICGELNIRFTTLTNILNKLIQDNKVQGSILEESRTFVIIPTETQQRLLDTLNSEIVNVYKFAQQFRLEPQLLNTLINNWLSQNQIHGSLIEDGKVFMGQEALAKSPTISRYTESLKEGNAISLDSITNKMGVTRTTVLSIFEDIAQKNTLVMTVSADRMIFLRFLYTCQVCDTKFDIPKNYYQCTKCKRYMCTDCASFLPGDDKICAMCQGEMLRMPEKCPKCNVTFYDLQRMTGMTNRCPICGFTLDSVIE